MASTDATFRSLQSAAKGLLYPSEADKPVKAVHWTAAEMGKEPVDADTIRRLCGLPASAPVESRALEEFFAPVTTPQDWHGEAEKQTVSGFQALERLVRSELQGVQVFHVGGPAAELVLVGRTADGDWAGVTARVVET